MSSEASRRRRVLGPQPTRRRSRSSPTNRSPRTSASTTSVVTPRPRLAERAVERHRLPPACGHERQQREHPRRTQRVSAGLAHARPEELQSLKGPQGNRQARVSLSIGHARVTGLSSSGGDRSRDRGHAHGVRLGSARAFAGRRIVSRRGRRRERGPDRAPCAPLARSRRRHARVRDGAGRRPARDHGRASRRHDARRLDRDRRRAPAPGAAAHDRAARASRGWFPLRARHDGVARRSLARSGEADLRFVPEHPGDRARPRSRLHPRPERVPRDRRQDRERARPRAVAGEPVRRPGSPQPMAGVPQP